MENLIFSLNATVPIFLLMVLGAVFKKIGWIDDVFATKMNGFVFKIALPVMVFNNLAGVDIYEAWDTRFVLYCFVVTAVSILICYLLSLLFDRSVRGEFIQAAYRSSAAILGMAFIENIYGSSTMGPLMIVGSVPLYNIAAVVVLTVFAPGNTQKVDGAMVKKTLKGVVTNPILLGIIAGLLWSALRLPFFTILSKTTSRLGAVATPMGLMAMGASFDIKKATGQIKPALVASFMKLLGFGALFLPLAVWLGFRNEQMVAILVMLGSCSTVSGYVMAKSMGHEGTVAASVVMLTTMLSAFTLTFWLFLMKTLGMV